VKRVDLAVLKQRGGLGCGPDDPAGIGCEPFKRRHRRPHRPTILGHRGSH
jgi:hypothetical protein